MPQYYTWLQAAVARDIDRQVEAMKYENNNKYEALRSIG